jgi:hypothetical protein
MSPRIVTVPSVTSSRKSMTVVAVLTAVVRSSTGVSTKMKVVLCLFRSSFAGEMGLPDNANPFFFGVEGAPVGALGDALKFPAPAAFAGDFVGVGLPIVQ